jgi:hypothetical protein
MIRNVDKARRAEFAERLLPMALPGPSSQRFAFAAISVEGQIRRQALTEQRLVDDAIKAGAKNIKSPADFDTFFANAPAVDAAFKRQPVAVQTALEQPLVEAAVKAGGFKKKEELTKFPALDAALKRQPVAFQSTLFAPNP